LGFSRHHASGALVFLLVLPNGRFTGGNYLPEGMLSWINENYTIRSSIPILFLGYVLSIKKSTVWVLLVCFMLVGLAELGQFLLPGRNPDWWDVFSGLWGTIVGIVLRKVMNY
jgi:hypothetical protein